MNHPLAGIPGSYRSQPSLLAWAIFVYAVLLGTSTLNTLAYVYSPGMMGFVGRELWVLLYASVAVGLMHNHGINWILWLLRYRIFLVILLVGAMASISWSYNPGVTLERNVHLLGGTLAGIYIGFTFSLQQTLRGLGWVFGVLLVMSILSALFLPQLGIEVYQGTAVWSGMFISKNILGFWSAVCVLLYVTLASITPTRSGRLLCWLFMLLSLVTLIMSDSATSMVGLIVAASIAIYIYLVVQFRLGFVRMVFLALMFMGVAALAIMNVDTAEMLGRSSDMTGRGDIWSQTWALIKQHPFSGYGYGAIWFPDEKSLWLQKQLIDLTWVAHHAHNGFLQVASELGLPLAFIGVLMVIQQMIEIIYCQTNRRQLGVLFVLAFAIVYLIGNFSEARFLVTRDLIWMMFLALPISMLRQVLIGAQSEESAANAGGLVPPGKPWLRPDSLGPMPGALRGRAMPLAAGAALSAEAAQGVDPEGPYADGPWTTLAGPPVEFEDNPEWREAGVEADPDPYTGAGFTRIRFAEDDDRYDKSIDDTAYDDTLELP